MSNLKETLESESQHTPIDPSLDITSEHFDPLKALYADNVPIPYKKAKVYDNISKYESAVIKKKNEATTSKETSHSTNPTSILSNTQTKTNKLKTFPAPDEPFVRRFLPHQRNKAFR